MPQREARRPANVRRPAARVNGLTNERARGLATLRLMSAAERNRWPETAAERLRAVTAELEEIVRDRALLGALTVEERTRLLRAAGDVYEPDLVQRRRWGKAVRRNEKAAKAERDEAVLSDTGIRMLREKPVFTTPNYAPPESFEQADANGDPDVRDVVEPQHCYVCKRLYVEIHPFYDQLCPACGDFNY